MHHFILYILSAQCDPLRRLESSQFLFEYYFYSQLICLLIFLILTSTSTVQTLQLYLGNIMRTVLYCTVHVHATRLYSSTFKYAV